jgi:hypothetical protein
MTERGDLQMAIVYQVRCFAAEYDQEFTSKDEAIAAAEQFNNAEMIKWAVSPNLPRCKPDLVYRSCAMSVRENRVWRQVNIFE